MRDPVKIYRLSGPAFHYLKSLARDEPGFWFEPQADFAKALKSVGVSDYTERTGITAPSLDSLQLTPPETTPRPRADIQSLDFHKNLLGMTPIHATDPHLLAWLNHFVLHPFAVKRWPGSRTANKTNYILRHWLTEKSADIYESSIAGRTWWLAELCKRAEENSGGAFKSEEALAHFSENAENYHNTMQFRLIRNPLMLAECVRALLSEAKGISTVGYRQIVRQLNREAGAVLPDALSREQLRRMILNITEQVMSDSEWVKDRKYVRNPSVTRVLSLGGGTQSSTLALMAEVGYEGIPKPDFAIFADTGWEPPEVYEHLEWLKSQLSYEVITVSAGNIRKDVLDGINPDGGKFLDLPVFVALPDGKTSISARQCTRHYKLEPIYKEVRRRLGLLSGESAPKGLQVEMWLGISSDEIVRKKPSRKNWITNCFPLIDRGYSRSQLYQWFKERYPDRHLPRSACIGCPYHSDTEWKHLKEQANESFRDAVEIDRALRELPHLRALSKGGRAYLHRNCQPLAEIDFSDTKDQTTHMLEECEGLCGI